MLSPRSNSHSYLMKTVSPIMNFNPRVICRVMDRGMGMHTTYRNLEPPFIPLSTAMPIIYSPNVDGTRAKLAFGRWALPILKKEIAQDDVFVVMRALNSIHDLVHSPEKCFEAIRIGMVERLGEIMLHERSFVREKVCMILRTMAGIEAGKRAIIKRYKILHKLALLLEDKVDTVRHKAQLALKEITFSPIAGSALNCTDYPTLLLRLIGGTPKTDNDEVLILHLQTMKDLLERQVSPEIFQYNVMDMFIELSNHSDERVRVAALDCLLLLCQTPMGKAEATAKNLVQLMCKKLFDPSLEVKVKAVGVLAFATITSKTRCVLCKECALSVIVQILENFNNSEGQLMAAALLKNIFEEPQGRCLVKKLKERIKNFFPANEDVQRHKNILLNLLRRRKL